MAGSTGEANGSAKTKVSSGEEVQLQAGNNLIIDQNGKTLAYSLNKNLKDMESAIFNATGGKTTVIKGDSIVQTDGGKTNTSNAAGNTTNIASTGATVTNAAGDITKVEATGTTVADAAGNKATFTKDGVTITKPGKDTVSLTGNGLDNGNNKIVNVADGTNDTDAVNVRQLDAKTKAATTELTANSGESADNTTGNIVLTKTTAADGHIIYDNKLNDKVTLGAADPTKAITVDGTNGTIKAGKDGNAVAINGTDGTIKAGDGTNPNNPNAGPVSLTKDGLNNGNNQIKGVAPGTDPTDAVNVSQLQASNANTSQAINQVAGEVQRVGAHAAAMAALKPIQYDPLEPTQVMAGVGNYRGETAAALGLAHYTNENTMFNIGVSVGGNHNMVNAGVTHKFGYSPEKKNIPDRYKAGPISSVYVMQDEVSSLKKENAEQKYVIADQAARLNTLEAENERQRQELAETKQGLDDLRAAVDRLLASKG